jgi:hypothetical protein
MKLIKNTKAVTRLVSGRSSFFPPKSKSFLGGALAGRTNLFYGLGPNPAAGKNCWRFTIWGHFLNVQNFRQITAALRRTIFYAAKLSQMRHAQKLKKNDFLNNTTKNPSELRLVSFWASSPWYCWFSLHFAAQPCPPSDWSWTPKNGSIGGAPDTTMSRSLASPIHVNWHTNR